MTSGPDEDAKWKIEIFRDKLRHSLGARFLLRFHVSMILLFTILVGWLVDWLLLKAGARSMALRYTTSILFAYGAFILGTYAWIEYSGVREYIKARTANNLVGDDVPRKPKDNLDTYTGFEGLLDPLGCMVLGEGCATVFAVFFVLFLLFYFFGGYLYLNTATFFADIVLELLLAAGLLKGISRYESSGWMSSVLNSTYWSLVYTIVIALLFAWWAHEYYPTAITLPDIIAQWRR